MRASFIAVLCLAICAALAAAAQAPAAAPAAAGFEIRGVILSGKTPIPGVTVSAANTLTGKKAITSTGLDGAYSLRVPSAGRYVVRAEMPAFQTLTSEVLLNPARPQAKVDLTLLLESRAPRPQSAAGETAGLIPNNGANEGFSSQQDAGLGGETPLADMPAMASSADATNEAVAVSGNQGETMNFGRGGEDIRDRIEEMRARGELPQGGPGMGGPGGPGGGGPMIFRMRASGRSFADIMSRPHGALYFSTGGSLFDALPYALSGAAPQLPDYSNYRFGGTVGGRLKIPHLFDAGPRTFFFANLFGTRGDTPYQAFSHVPTELERSGDFSQTLLPNGQPVQLYDPTTHLPIASVPVSAAAQALLKYIPLPNSPGTQNFRLTTTASNRSTVGAFRLMHSFGAMPQGPRGFGPRGRNGINFGFNVSDSTAQQLSPFPLLGGTLHSRGVNVNGGYVRSRKEWTNMLRLNFNEQRSDQSNRYAGVEDVAAAAGIAGVSTAPSDWGVPNLSFTNYRSLTDLAPRSEHDRTVSIGDTVAWFHGKHNLRFGGDYRRMWTVLRSNTDPRGTFVFTGALTAAQSAGGPVAGTGYDFADFLLGLPQQTSIQFSPNAYYFAANGWDLYVMDDWRVRGNLTLDFGLRYEYFGPYTEAHDRLVNLDAAPGFTAVAAVYPGQAGPYGGAYPASLVRPDRNNFAPRIGIAWKPFSKTVVRAGYGINYNGGQYRDIVQHLAFQPPFSFTETNIASAATPLTLTNGFPAAAVPGVTNNYAVDPNYRLGYVQVWNLNVQRDVGWNTVVNVGYTGSKGTRLDIVEAPNRGPDGLLIPGVQPFLWETSDGSSILHAGSVRVRRRFTGGVSLGATYTFSKSIDNASSIGGGATVVAQDPLDLAAERGLSSFDQRHRFTGDYVIDLPFGANRKWLNNGGALARIAGDWEWSGSFTIASGTPWTAQVVGSFGAVAQGANGSLRADVTGQPIALPNPSIREWFNTAAFTVPPAGQYGTAGRNTIIGPGTTTFNMSLSKTFSFKDFYSLEMRLDANNVFNTPQYTSIDTVVNSPTFGQVVAVGNMRQVQVATRFRF
jgi:hypothetical protein